MLDEFPQDLETISDDFGVHYWTNFLINVGIMSDNLLHIKNMKKCWPQTNKPSNQTTELKTLQPQTYEHLYITN